MCVFQHGANVKIVDHEQRNALWYAQNSGSTECMELLRNSDCPENSTLPRQRPNSQGNQGGGSNTDVLDKMQASVI